MTTLSMTRGETVNVEITVLDSNGELIDLTGYAIVWKAGQGLEYSTEGPDPAITISGTKATFQIPAADTLALENFESNKDYEVKVRTPEGEIKTVASGTLQILPTLVELEAT